MQPRDASGRFMRQDLRKRTKLSPSDWYMVCVVAGTIAYLIGRYFG